MLEEEKKKTIDINEASVTLREDGVVHVNYKKGTLISYELQLTLMDIFNEICGETTRPFLYTAEDYVSISKEVQSNVKIFEKKYPGKASAVVADNLAYKLIANFYLRVYKTKKPYKVFGDMDSALTWLKTFIPGKL